MEQQAIKLSTSVDPVTEHQIAEAQRNAWVEKFLENARKALGLPPRSDSNGTTLLRSSINWAILVSPIA
jgi:hypothetical protein